MEKLKNYIEAKNNLAQTAFLVMNMAKIDILELPRFIREVADDIEEEIKKQKDN